MTPEKFKAIVKTAKADVINHMGVWHSIKDTFNVRVVNLPKHRFIGSYKSFSQFGGNGPTFRVYSSIVRCSRENQREDRKVGIESKLHSLVYEGVYDTLLHEYGHVIFEFFRVRMPDMHFYILNKFETEENFAEEFKDYIRDSQFSTYRDEFRYVLKKWRNTLKEWN